MSARRPPGPVPQWRVRKAAQFLRDAELAFQSDRWETCVNRSYYAAYHLVAALLESWEGGRRREWRHDSLANEFRRKFGRTGFVFSAKDAETLETLYRARAEADYDDIRFGQLRTRASLVRAQQLCARLREELSNG